MGTHFAGRRRKSTEESRMLETTTCVPRRSYGQAGPATSGALSLISQQLTSQHSHRSISSTGWFDHRIQQSKVRGQARHGNPINICLLKRDIIIHILKITKLRLGEIQRLGRSHKEL